MLVVSTSKLRSLTDFYRKCSHLLKLLFHTECCCAVDTKRNELFAVTYQYLLQKQKVVYIVHVFRLMHFGLWMESNIRVVLRENNSAKRMFFFVQSCNCLTVISFNVYCKYFENVRSKKYKTMKSALNIDVKLYIVLSPL